jgi:hypothetical protein
MQSSKSNDNPKKFKLICIEELESIRRFDFFNMKMARSEFGELMNSEKIKKDHEAFTLFRTDVLATIANLINSTDV